MRKWKRRKEGAEGAEGVEGAEGGDEILIIAPSLFRRLPRFQRFQRLPLALPLRSSPERRTNRAALAERGAGFGVAQ